MPATLNHCREALRKSAAHVLAQTTDPGADLKTLAEQQRQTAELVLAEIAAMNRTPDELKPLPLAASI